MSRSLFRYIWRHSRRDQLIIFLVVLASLPFYYVSLDLPRRIVNEAIQGKAFDKGRTTAAFLEFSVGWPDWLGGGHHVQIFEGFQIGRIELLFGLSILFLVFVLINGWFKYWINVAKGALGERMMRRMRFELFSFALRFTPEALRTVKSSEAATIIKDEVEPIGGFIGDAFIQPVFLGTQAATALMFILLQSVWLGLMAGAVVGVQFVVIPRMRRELLRLGRMRQLASRRLAGRIGEVIDGIEAVRVHDSATWERAEVGDRLYELFDIRFQIYRRKFIVKFLNNLLAQMTPFFFYAFGGYFALKGRLDIGQLVAVIAAYRELPPPLKELIDWDQQRLDVQVKYDQVVGYFAPEKLLPVDEAGAEDEAGEPLVGTFSVSGLQTFDAHGTAILDHVDVAFELPGRIALVADGGPAASSFARVLACRDDGHSGEVKIGERDLAGLPARVLGRRIAYAGVDPVLFPGSLRSNLLYGLRIRQVEEAEADAAEALRISEAKRTGNPVENPKVDWLDIERTGHGSPEELDEYLLDLLKRFRLEEDVYRFGIDGTIDPERRPELADQIVQARHRLREKLEEDGMSDLVEAFDPETYNSHATVAENLLFGVPTSPGLMGRALAEHPGFREVLDKAELTDDLVAMGARIGETMVDIFRGLPSGHPLFDQFSFVNADELGEVEDSVKRFGRHGRGGPNRDDRLRLIALPLAYVEPRHRLGLLDDAMRERLVAGRKQVHEMLAEEEDPGVAFYDPEKLNVAALVRDNLLFGRVNGSIANAREQVRAAGAAVIDEFSLRDDIERVGLDHQVGPAGRLLTAAQRTSVDLIRCLVRRPDILVVDGALAALGERRAEAALQVLFDDIGERTLAVVLPNDGKAEPFETLVRFSGAQASVERTGARASEGPDAKKPAETQPAETKAAETQSAEAEPDEAAPAEAAE